MKMKRTGQVLVLLAGAFGCTGWIELSFTVSSQRFFLEPSFETRYSYYDYSAPELPSWQYSSTVVTNSLK